MKRWNITLPDDVSQELGRIPNKSRFIAAVLRENLKKSKKEQLHKLLIEGYQQTREEDALINKEWEAATLEGWE